MPLTEGFPNVLAIKIHENTEKSFTVFYVAFLLFAFILFHCKDVSLSFFQSASAQERSRAEVSNLRKRFHLMLSLSQTDEARRRI